MTRDEWRRERRRIVREHHPDRGGAPGEMSRHLHELDASYAAHAQTAPRVSTRGSTRRAARQARRVLTTLVRTVRARTPPGWPGHQRYIDLGDTVSRQPRSTS